MPPRTNNKNELGSSKPSGGASGGEHPGGQRPPPPTQQRRFVHRVGTSIKHAVGKSLRLGGAAIGIVTVANIASYYYEIKQVDDFFGAAISDDDDDDEKKKKKAKKYKKRVLVLPFDNLKVIEQRKSNDIDLQRFSNTGSKRPTITIEAKELVDIIHRAASDPNISAVYADFGEGMHHPIGYAHIEEIRNAIRIFNESHRVHRDPNVNHNPVFALVRNGEPKPSYAFGYGYRWNEYFLASAFSYVSLQARGNLELFGVATTNVFLGGMLDKYGIKAHVFRHGEYKNAPSIFTDRKYSRSHLETVKSMTSSMNDTIRTCIGNSRALNFDNVMWQSIHDYGSLTSTNSSEIGLVDCIPPVDPLPSLLGMNKEEANKKRKQASKKTLTKVKKDIEGDETKAEDEQKNDKSVSRQKFEEKFGIHECFSKFTASESVSLGKYKEMLDKKKNIERNQRKISDMLHNMSEKSTATSMILSALGLQPDKTSSIKRDKVAVLTVAGSIDSTLSYEIIRSLRKIKQDKNVKSVVLRVDSPGGSVVSSEAILEEIKLLDKPIICSMSNAAASGGYYIACKSEKIFANPTTLTGSIGVFGTKFDATKWAKSYGISGDYYPRGSHAAAMHPLTPLTPVMKENIARQVLDYYDYFKGIVSTSRSLPLDAVEKVAQGRVWTGEQAKEVGLVDALGGLDRAISYAKTTHAKTEQVDVEYWPKKMTLPEFLTSQGSSSYADLIRALVFGPEYSVSPRSIEEIVSQLSDLKFSEKPLFMMMTMDEETALDIILRGE